MELLINILITIIIIAIVVIVLASYHNKNRIKNMGVKCKECQYNYCGHYDYPCYSCMHRNKYKDISYFKPRDKIKWK